MIWFFPEGVAPITGTNLVSAVTFAHQQSTVPVKYFTSVPYILQMLAEKKEGMRLLQSMDLVGVGGAALPSAAGDKLVQAGVNLLSRMGSAECGFLMSSHRDYPHDKEWQYLRPVDMPGLLSFEPRDGGLSELIVKPNWPFKIKTNCEDGSYATADLFEPHTSIQNAWRYHSRADAQIALANGKKFDPSPMEASILASTSALRDVLIFGAGRDYPGILLFPAEKDSSENDVVASVWPIIESMNSSTQSHARLSKSMLVVVSLGDGERPLEKSSKGTILRRQAEEKYSRNIESAYDTSSSSLGVSEPVSNDQLPSVVQDCFARILGRDIDPNRDLYEQGVDSISCIKIRKLVESSCLPEQQRPLPLNIIYDQGTVNALCAHLSSLRSGIHESDGQQDTAELKRMEELAKKYSDFQDVHVRPRKKKVDVVVLTGATGLLGAHLLHLLRYDNNTTKVYCLLRAKTPEEANQRVHNALITRELPGLDDVSSKKNCEIIALPCDFSRKDLGLSEEYQSHLQEEATAFIHAAWTVNFTLRLGSFENQVAGTRYLIDMALGAGADLAFISSIAAVSSSSASNVPETLSNDPAEASPLGYSQSKWVTEKVCSSANEWVQSSLSGENERPSVSIVRIGQLCSNQMGVWNTSEAYPLMLSTASITGCLPDLPQETLNWLPVELAAQAVLDLSRIAEPNGTDRKRITQTPVYHVFNPHDTPTWRDLLQWIKEKNEKPKFDVVSPMDWVIRLEEAVTTKASNHPSQALLSMWKGRYYSESKDKSGKGPSPAASVFGIERSKEASATMRDVSPVEPERVSKIWRWVHRNITT
jgi:thioester reductase-like protein